jgi:hypothetical protein
MLGNNKGQATLEYVLLLFIVLAMFLAVAAFMRGSNLFQKVVAPVKDSFAHSYQYGHPKARGFGESGGPTHHPREYGEENFRLYINPR